MAFSDYVARIFGKKPVWLYRIEVDGQRFHMVSQARSFTTGADRPDDTYPTGQTFDVTAIKRGEIIETTLASRSDTTLNMPTSAPVIQAILDSENVQETKVTIWQGYVGDPDEEYLIRFIGRVVSLEPTLLLTTLNCETDLTLMNRSSVAQVMQRPCRHAHYFTNSDGGGCRLNLADHQQEAPISAVNGLSVTVPLAGLQPEGVFLAGVFEYDGIEYMIENHLGEVLFLESEPVGLAEDFEANNLLTLPTNVLIAEGCNLTAENCLAFDNIVNFGGFRFMLDTPFDGRSIA